MNVHLSDSLACVAAATATVAARTYLAEHQLDATPEALLAGIEAAKEAGFPRRSRADAEKAPDQL